MATATARGPRVNVGKPGRQTTRKKLRELFDGIYNEYIVDIYQNAHSNALKNSWDNGWSGGLLLLAVGDDAAARAARRCALMQHALAAAARLRCCHNYNSVLIPSYKKLV